MKIKPSLVFNFSLYYFLLSFSFCLAQSQNWNTTTQNEIEKVEQGLTRDYVLTKDDSTFSIEERMKHHKVPGLSIAVIDNYEIRWAKGYGWADKEAGRTVTPEILFQAASMSKSVHALGVLKLVQAGKLDLDTDINNYLTSWEFPYSKKTGKKKITLAHLLTHTAGLSVSGFPGYQQGEKIPTTKEILNGKKSANTDKVKSEFEPGLKFQYSGGGTVVSQLILEDLTGMPYDQYMQEEVLNALGMQVSSFQQPPASAKKELLATAYWAQGEPLEGQYHIYPEKAPAGLWTNPTEYARFIIEIQKALAGKSEQFISQDLAKKIMQPIVENTNTGLGVFIEDRNGSVYFNHGGSNEGFKCQYCGSMEGGKGVVIMVNSENFDIVGEVLNSVARAYNWKGMYYPGIIEPAQLSSENIAPLLGEYAYSSGRTASIIQKENKYFYVNTAGKELELIPESNRVFLLKLVAAKIEFRENESGQVDRLVFIQSGVEQVGKKL